MSVDHTENAVLYTDGGYKQNLSIGGWGVHGYTYENHKTKSTAHPKFNITAKGYLPKEDKTPPVLVKTVINGFGSIHDKADTSNTAELTALQKALTWIKDHQIVNAHIKMDSQYALNGFTKSLDYWQSNDWNTRDMKPLANVGHWKALSSLKDDLKGNVNLQFEWVKGHKGHLGNELADELATKAMKLGLQGQIENWDEIIYKTTKPQVKKSRLLSQPQWFFSAIAPEPQYLNFKTYYLGFTGKRVKGSSIVNLVGKPINEARLSILYMKESDPVLDVVESEMRKMAEGQYRGLIVGDLNNILKSDNYNEIDKHGSGILIKDYARLRIMLNPTDIACEEITPARLAYKWVDDFNMHESYFQSHLKSLSGIESSITSHDITDQIYDRYEKKSKKKTTVKINLKSEIGTGTKTLDFRINVLKANKTKELNIRCLLGQDLPDRNTLAAIAAPEVKVYILTWPESSTVIRFAGVLHCQEGIGMWCGPYSNLIVI